MQDIKTMTYVVLETTDGGGAEIYRGDDVVMALAHAQHLVMRWDLGGYQRHVFVTQYCPCGQEKTLFEARIN